MRRDVAAQRSGWVCPPCCWQWPSLADDLASCVLAKERTGLPVFGLGFRLRQPESVVHHEVWGFSQTWSDPWLVDGQALARPSRNTTLMPVPSHWRRVWRRGFNPSEALCDGLAKAWNRDISSDTATDSAPIFFWPNTQGNDWIRWKGCLSPCQGTRSPAARRGLVDDVLTGGATFRACQKSLTAAGHNVLGVCGSPWLDSC